MSKYRKRCASDGLPLETQPNPPDLPPWNFEKNCAGTATGKADKAPTSSSTATGKATTKGSATKVDIQPIPTPPKAQPNNTVPETALVSNMDLHAAYYQQPKRVPKTASRGKFCSRGQFSDTNGTTSEDVD